MTSRIISCVLAESGIDGDGTAAPECERMGQPACSGLSEWPRPSTMGKAMKVPHANELFGINVSLRIRQSVMI